MAPRTELAPEAHGGARRPGAPALDALTVGVYPLRSGSTLVCLDADRRAAVDAPCTDVARALVDEPAGADGGPVPGFAAELRRLVDGMRADRARTLGETRRARAVLDLDPSLAAVAAPPLAALLDELGIPVVHGLGDLGGLGADDLLVTLAVGYDHGRLRAVEDAVTASGAWWACAWLEEGQLVAAPFRDDRPAATLRDLAGRWLSTATDEQHARSRLRPPHAAVSTSPSDATLKALGAAHLARAVERWLLGRDPQAGYRCLRVDRHGVEHTDPVLPVPHRSTVRHPTGLFRPLDVVSTRTGIVTRLRPVTFRTAVPPQLRYVESETADMSRLAPWASNTYNAGSSWGDEEAAAAGAVGEAVERYCGNAVDGDDLIDASYDELVRAGRRAVDPRTLALFSRRQYDDPGFPFVEFSRTLRTPWVAGWSLATGEEVLVPAALTFVNWNAGVGAGRPPTNPAFYPGIAAAPSLDQALANALEEVVERDAAMLWWLSGHAAPTLPADALVDSLVPRAWREETGTTVRVVPLLSRMGVPAVAALVSSPAAGLTTMGLAARNTPEAAVSKALLEGFGLLETAVDMQDPRGGFWSSVTAEGAGAVKPVRADRRYLDDYRPDFRDVTDLYSQLQVQLDPRAAAQVDSRVAAASVDLASLPRLPERDPAAYVRELTERGFEPVAVDLTTADVALAGWRAVRVLVPGLLPNFPTAFPPLGTGRATREPRRLGWREDEMPEAEAYRFPMPYA